MADYKKFPVEVLTPEGEVFNGEVEMLSTRTVTGEIGILANHAPLLAMLGPTELRLHLGGDELHRYAQGEGYLEVSNNHAMVLVEDAVEPGKLDLDRLKEKLKDAELRLQSSAEGSAEAQVAERDKRRAEAFIQIAER